MLCGNTDENGKKVFEMKIENIIHDNILKVHCFIRKKRTILY